MYIPIWLIIIILILIANLYFRDWRNKKKRQFVPVRITILPLWRSLLLDYGITNEEGWKSLQKQCDASSDETAYNVLINGETGKIKGEYPKSPVKIAAIVIVILGILFGIYLASSDEDVSYNNDKKIQYSELVKNETVSSLEEIMF